MPNRKLRDHGDGSGVVALDKGWLERDGVLDENENVPDEQRVQTDRLGERTYLVRVPRGGVGDIPEIDECEEIERIAAYRAQEMLSEDPLQNLRKAD